MYVTDKQNFTKLYTKQVLNVLYKFCLWFLTPGLKGPPGAFSNRIVPVSWGFLCVCLSVRNSVPLTNKVQYLKFGWWYSNQTSAVSSSMGSSHFTDITCTWDGASQNVGLGDFCHILTLLPPGIRVSQTHVQLLLFGDRNFQYSNGPSFNSSILSKLLTSRMLLMPVLVTSKWR